MISFVVCSIDPAKLDALSRNLAEKMSGESHELIAIGDAKSICEGYNRGAAESKGETIVFCHDDIEILGDQLPAKLHSAMNQFDIVGVAGTDRVIGGLWSMAGPPHLFGQIAQPHADGFKVEIFSAPRPLIGGIHALDGVFIAVRHEVLEKVRFDEQSFDGWHLYDSDFTFTAHQAGLKLGVTCEIPLIHCSPGHADEAWMKYAQRFNRKHLSHLYPMAPRPFSIASVTVKSRQELLDVMSPRFCGDAAVS